MATAPPQVISPPPVVSIQTTKPVTPPAVDNKEDLPAPPSPIEGEEGLAALDKGKSLAPVEDANGDLGRKATIRATSAQQFEEAKRKMLQRDMEEKIAVMPEEPEPLTEKKGESGPMMSATSYPGQEWNPYEFAYEEDD